MKKKKSKWTLHGQWDQKKQWKHSIYSMWQEIFADPEPFVDYYYKEMYSKNRVYTMWGEQEGEQTVSIQSVEQKECLFEQYLC